MINWDRFLDIIRNADKVIFLDAFTSRLTIDFINSINVSDDMFNYDIIELKKSNVNRNIYFKSTFESWCGSIINSLKENKKTFIFYPFKDGCKDYVSMENLNVSKRMMRYVNQFLLINRGKNLYWIFSFHIINREQIF